MICLKVCILSQQFAGSFWYEKHIFMGSEDEEENFGKIVYLVFYLPQICWSPIWKVTSDQLHASYSKKCATCES